MTSVTIPRPRSTANRLHVVRDPSSGHVVEVPVGSCVELTFPPRGHATSHWRVEDRPGHLVPLASERWRLQFLVFETGTPQPLRLVRTCDDCEGCRGRGDAREILVVPAAS
jgi:hypothetical protein